MKKIFTFVCLIFLLMAGESFTQDKQDWKFIHPAPQSNLLRKIKMISETEWVAVGANGTFMHTSNSGTNWYFHHFAGRVNATTLATTQAYDAWFFNSNTGIVTSDQGYAGRTVDGGVTIDSVLNGLVALNSRCWSVWFADANTGYIGAGSQTSFTTRILKTTNGGSNWSVVYSDLSGSTSYLTSLGGADANTVCASWGNGTCLRTTNGGTNWTLTASTFSTIMNNISFLNSTTGFAAGSGGTVSRTTDAGASWVPVNTPTTDWSMFQVKPVSATEIYAVGDPSFLYKSTDMGTSWSSLPISVSGPTITFVWYSIDFRGSTYVLSGDYGIVAKSTDGCATWSSNSIQLGNQLMYDIKTVPGTGKYWAVGRPFPPGSSTKEIMYSSNSGTSWVTRDLGFTGDFFAISMINENTGYVSGQNNRVLKTIDGGITWSAKTGPSPVSSSQLYSMEFLDENTGFVFVNFSTVSGGNVFKTTNGGDNWTQYTTGAPSENIYSADMVDANTGYCTMNSSGRSVYKTTNGGVTWDSLKTRTAGFTSNVKSVSAPSANTVYICQSGGTNRVGKSTDGGANWTSFTMPVVADFTSIYFINDNTGYVTGNSTTAICRTTNGGLNWTTQNTHGITNLKVYASPGDTAWCIGGNENILRYVGVSSQLKLNLSVLMEGMYNSGTNQLARKDTVKVYLRGNVSPYTIKDSASAVIDSLTHSAQITFTRALSGTYYIVVKHFNTVETWSKSGGETIITDGSYYNYDFTTSSSKAYGNNMEQVGTKWCMYSGDINGEGTIDGSDVASIDNDGYNFVTGNYLVTDLDANGLIDGTDLLIAGNNASNFIGIIRP